MNAYEIVLQHCANLDLLRSQIANDLRDAALDPAIERRLYALYESVSGARAIAHQIGFDLFADGHRVPVTAKPSAPLVFVPDDFATV